MSEVPIQHHPTLALLAGPPVWVRGHSRLRGERIELDPATLERYNPYREGLAAQLLFQLAAVRTPADALAVASPFGLLYAGPEAERYSEPFARWALTAGELRDALALYAALRQALAGDQAGARARLKPLLVARRGRLAPQGRAYLDGYEPLGQASLLVASIVSDGLAGVSESLVAAVSVEQEADGHTLRGQPGYFFFGPELRDLAALAYHTLALTVAQQVQVEICPECATAFAPSHGNQKYCRRACLNRAGSRRFRERTRGQ